MLYILLLVHKNGLRQAVEICDLTRLELPSLVL